jgi:hypothetical protein
MILLNETDSTVVASLAQYQKLPLERKHALVNRLSEQAKPIGMILIGESPESPSEECVNIANEFREWTRRNRKKRSSIR